jgi:hypothetical protein
MFIRLAHLAIFNVSPLYEMKVWLKNSERNALANGILA